MTSEPKPKPPGWFTAWIKELREQAGLSQDDLAEAMGIERRPISRWENGKGGMSALSFLRLLDAVGAKVVPPPPAEAPRAINAELAEIRRQLGRIRGRPDSLAAGGPPFITDADAYANGVLRQLGADASATRLLELASLHRELAEENRAVADRLEQLAAAAKL